MIEMLEDGPMSRPKFMGELPTEGALVDTTPSPEPAPEPVAPVEEEAVTWGQDDPVVEETSEEVVTWGIDDPVVEDETTLTAEDTQENLLDEDVIKDQGMMSDIRQYMVTRKGVQYADRSDEDVYDDWKSHMRTVEAGEVSLVGEIIATNRYKPEEKEVASRTYQVWEQIAPMWEQGAGETAEAVWDYASSALNPIESPSTLISLGLGKALTTATAKPLAMAAVKAALRQGGKAGAKKVIRNNVIKQAVKSGLIGGSLDAATNMITDYAYQNDVQMELGVRDEWSIAQTAASGALGLALPTALNVGGALRAGKGVGTTPMEAGRIRGIKTRQAQQAVAGQIQARMAAAAQSMDPADWQAAKGAGGAFNLRESDRKILSDTFFDHNDPNSVVNILQDAGVKIDFEEGKVANNIISYIDDLPDAQRIPIEEAWEGAVGVPYREARDKLVAVVSEEGEKFAQISLAKRKLSEVAQNAINNSRKPKVEDLGPKTLGYIQNLWKRLLVSHPATTAANVQGWAVADVTRLAGNTVQGLLTLSYDPSKGGRMLKHSLLDRPRMYSDLVGTKAQWDDVLTNIMPKWARGEVSRETFGGVASKSPRELYGMPDTAVVRGAEKVAEKAAQWTFVNAQDSWTRAISGMMELDRQARVKYGLRYADMVKAGREKELANDDMLWAQVVRTSLEDTFSFDYSHGKSGFNKMAKAIQTISNAPGLGFVFPFGKFMANTVAFTAQHSPLGAFNFAKHLMRKEGEQATDALAKSVVGTTALWMLGEYSYEKMGEGFDFNQLETSTGSIMDRANLAPLSQYLLAGRMWRMLNNGEQPTPDMYKDLSKQLAVGEFADLGNTQGVKVLTSFLDYLGSDEEGAAEAREDFFTQMGKLGGGIAAGFTRPLDVVNSSAQAALEGTGITAGPVQVDRKIVDGAGEATFLASVRYFDQMFAPFTDDGVVGTAARSIARPEGDIKNPNSTGSAWGLKEDKRMTWANKALAMVGLPEFRIEIPSAVPEYDRMMAEQAAQLLDNSYKSLLASPDFKKASMDRKRTLVKDAASKIKEKVLDQIEKGYRGSEPLILDMRRKFTIAPDTEKKEALEAFDLEAVNPRELTYSQLKLLTEYMERSRKDYGKFMKHFD